MHDAARNELSVRVLSVVGNAGESPSAPADARQLQRMDPL